MLYNISYLPWCLTNLYYLVGHLALWVYSKIHVVCNTISFEYASLLWVLFMYCWIRFFVNALSIDYVLKAISPAVEVKLRTTCPSCTMLKRDLCIGRWCKSYVLHPTHPDHVGKTKSGGLHLKRFWRYVTETIEMCMSNDIERNLAKDKKMDWWINSISIIGLEYVLN